MGIQITNGEFTSFLGAGWGSIAQPDSCQIVLNMTNVTYSGPVRLVNAAFWGPSNEIARVSGKSVLWRYYSLI